MMRCVEEGKKISWLWARLIHVWICEEEIVKPYKILCQRKMHELAVFLFLSNKKKYYDFKDPGEKVSNLNFAKWHVLINYLFYCYGHNELVLQRMNMALKMCHFVAWHLIKKRLFLQCNKYNFDNLLRSNCKC